MSHRGCSARKVVLRNFTNLTGKHLWQSLLFHKVVGLRTATLLKKRLWHRCFSVNFAKFLKTPFFTEHLQGLLLSRSSQSKMFFEIGVLKNFATFTEELLCWILFFIQFQALRPATLLKTNSNTGVFLWIFKNSFFSYRTPVVAASESP